MHLLDDIPMRAGFTLIELAIVLVVVGLVTGGIIMGKELIRQSELQSVISDIEHYERAINGFYAKYNYFPGDLPNAEDYWGSDTNCPNTAENNVAKRATCNG